MWLQQHHYQQQHQYGAKLHLQRCGKTPGRKVINLTWLQPPVMQLLRNVLQLMLKPRGQEGVCGRLDKGLSSALRRNNSKTTHQFTTVCKCKCEWPLQS